MKTLTLAMCMLLSIHLLPAQNFNLSDVVTFGNSQYNQGFSVNSHPPDIYMTARNQGVIDVGIGAPYNLNGLAYTENSIWGEFDQNFTLTDCAGILTTNNAFDHLYMLDGDYNDVMGYLLSGHYYGTVTVNTVNYPCTNPPCGFAVQIDNNCTVVDFEKFEATSGASVSQVKWHDNQMVFGITYTGTMTKWGNTYTSTGVGSDVAIGVTSSLNNSLAVSATFSGGGYEGVTVIDESELDKLALAVYSYTNSSASYTDPLGVSTPFNFSPYTRASITMKVDATSLNLESSIMRPSSGGLYDVKGIYPRPSGGIIVGGTLPAGTTIYPDEFNLSWSLNSTYTGMCLLAYDQNDNFTGHLLPNPNEENTMNKFRDLDDNDWACMTGYVSRFYPGPNLHVQKEVGVLYVIDENLNMIDSLSIGGREGGCQFHGFDLDSLNNFYVTGMFLDSIDFDPSASTSWVVTPQGNSNDIFIAKYDASSIGINETKKDISLLLYPVPARDKITVHARLQKDSEFSFCITDISGRILFQKNYSDTNSIDEVLNTEKIPAGIYFARLVSDSNVASRKFVIIGK